MSDPRFSGPGYRLDGAGEAPRRSLCTLPNLTKEQKVKILNTIEFIGLTAIIILSILPFSSAISIPSKAFGGTLLALTVVSFGAYWVQLRISKRFSIIEIILSIIVAATLLASAGQMFQAVNIRTQGVLMTTLFWLILGKLLPLCVERARRSQVPAVGVAGARAAPRGTPPGFQAFSGEGRRLGSS